MTMSFTLLDAAVAVVPVVIISFAVIIGSKQAREFHDHTGDQSLLVHLAALSTFRSEAAPAPAPAPANAPGKKIAKQRKSELVSAA